MFRLEFASRRCFGAPGAAWAEREESCLGFNVVGDVVDGAPQWDFSDWPRGIIGQVGGQDADPQLSLWDTHRHTHALKTAKGNRN